MSAYLEVNALNKSYGEHHVLMDFSAALQPGSVTTILGPNGSGKTTFIKTILGIQPSDSGVVSIDGCPCALPYSADLRRKFLYIPDDPLVVAYLSGQENLDYMSALYGVSLSRIQAEAILKKYGLGSWNQTMEHDPENTEHWSVTVYYENGQEYRVDTNLKPDQYASFREEMIRAIINYYEEVRPGNE